MVMTLPVLTPVPDPMRVSATARLWRIAGTMGPIILSRFRDLTFLFAGTFPEIVVALVNAVVLPLLTKKAPGSSDQS
jgi:hypothetical protein